MRGYGTLHPTDLNPVPADTMVSTLLTGGTAQAFDYPIQNRGFIVRLSGATTAGAAFYFAFNDGSTAAAWAAAASTAASTAAAARNSIVGPTGVTYQIPGGSTGFSLISGSSGVVSVEFWTKGGSS